MVVVDKVHVKPFELLLTGVLPFLAVVDVHNSSDLRTLVVHVNVSMALTVMTF